MSFFATLSLLDVGERERDLDFDLDFERDRFLRTRTSRLCLRVRLDSRTTNPLDRSMLRSRSAIVSAAI